MSTNADLGVPPSEPSGCTTPLRAYRISYEIAPGFSVTPSGNVLMTNESGLRVSSLPGGGVTAEPALTAYWKRVSRAVPVQSSTFVG